MELKQSLETETSKVKSIDAAHVAKDIMFARRRGFEYQDKPNKHLSQILAEVKEKLSVPVMYALDGSELFFSRKS